MKSFDKAEGSETTTTTVKYYIASFTLLDLEIFLKDIMQQPMDLIQLLDSSVTQQRFHYCCCLRLNSNN